MYKFVYSLFKHEASCDASGRALVQDPQIFLQTVLFLIFIQLVLQFHILFVSLFIYNQNAYFSNIEQEISMLFQLRLARELGFCEGVQITCLFTNALPCLEKKKKKQIFKT